MKEIKLQSEVVLYRPEIPWKIAVFHNGWFVAGRLDQSGPNCRLEHAVSLRLEGDPPASLIGMALNGPQPINIDGRMPDLTFHESLAIFIDCNTENWKHLEIDEDNQDEKDEPR